MQLKPNNKYVTFQQLHTINNNNNRNKNGKIKEALSKRASAPTPRSLTPSTLGWKVDAAEKEKIRWRVYWVHFFAVHLRNSKCRDICRQLNCFKLVKWGWQSRGIDQWRERDEWYRYCTGICIYMKNIKWSMQRHKENKLLKKTKNKKKTRLITVCRGGKCGKYVQRSPQVVWPHSVAAPRSHRQSTV